MIVKLNEPQLREIISSVIESLGYKQEVMEENDIVGGFIKNNVICEGLIKSYPISSVRNMLLGIGVQEYGIRVTKIPFFLYKNKNNESPYQIYLTFTEGFKGIPQDFFEELKSRVEAYGWYFSMTLVDGKRFKGFANDSKNDGPINVVLEPKFDVLLSYDEIPDKLYHITRKSVVEKIMKKGIVPKSTYDDVYYPERIYMFLDKPQNVEMNKNEEECVLEIDTKLLNRTNNIYMDPNSNVFKACFTMEPIPPFAIKKIEN